MESRPKVNTLDGQYGKLFIPVDQEGNTKILRLMYVWSSAAHGTRFKMVK